MLGAKGVEGAGIHRELRCEEARITNAQGEIPRSGARLVGGGEPLAVAEADIAAACWGFHTGNDGQITGGSFEDAVFAGDGQVGETLRIGLGFFDRAIALKRGRREIVADEVAGGSVNLEVVNDADGKIDAGDEAVVERVKITATARPGCRCCVAEFFELREILAK